MTQQYDNNLRGVLFKNDRRETEQQPLYKGSCEIDGVEYWISSWLKDGQKGRFMSLSFKAKEQQAPASKQPISQSQRPMHGTKTDSGFDDIDDDVPF